jgi:hypothetical protein
VFIQKFQVIGRHNPSSELGFVGLFSCVGWFRSKHSMHPINPSSDTDGDDTIRATGSSPQVAEPRSTRQPRVKLASPTMRAESWVGLRLKNYQP